MVVSINGNKLLGLALVASVLVFVWHAELAMFDPPYLTNGFMRFDPVQVYHASMYLMFACVGLSSYRLVRK